MTITITAFCRTCGSRCEYQTGPSHGLHVCPRCRRFPPPDHDTKLHCSECGADIEFGSGSIEHGPGGMVHRGCPGAPA